MVLQELLKSSNPLQSNTLQKCVCDATSTPTINVSLVTFFNLSFRVKFISNLRFMIVLFTSAKMQLNHTLKFLLFNWHYFRISGMLPSIISRIFTNIVVHYKALFFPRLKKKLLLIFIILDSDNVTLIKKIICIFLLLPFKFCPYYYANKKAAIP